MNYYMKKQIAVCMMVSVGSYQCVLATDTSKKDCFYKKPVAGNSKLSEADKKQLPKKESFGLVENIAIGGAVGAAEVLLPGQIFSYAMNSAIKHQPFVLSQSYAGVTANALGQMPITAMQKVVKVAGSDNLEAWQKQPLSERQKVCMSYLSGVAASLIDTPSNAVQIFLQHTEGPEGKEVNAAKTTRQAIQELGLEKLYRGGMANALIKEGPFVVGYQYLAGKCSGIVSDYVGDNMAAAALGGSAAGVVTAVVTQPGAVIRNSMQNYWYLNNSPYKSAWDAAKHLYKFGGSNNKGGISALFTGLQARGARVAIAVPLYVFYTNQLETKLRDLKK